jgi:hypothetical protein
MDVKIVIIAVLLGTGIFLAGCASTQSYNPETTAIPTEAVTQTTTVTAEPTYAVTKPVLIKGDDIYSIKITLDAEETGTNTLNVFVHYDSSTLPSTGAGSELMATLFAYNYADVPFGFDPKTTDDVISAGIPYKRVASVVYPNNKVNAGAELPTDSVQGSLNLAKAYNYGVIIEKTGTRR